MVKHLTIVSVGFIVIGLLGLATALFVFIAVAGGGWLSGDREAMLITSGIGLTVAGFIVALSLPTLLAGIGLHRRRPWARVVALVVAGLQLVNLPFGTVLGVYAMWVLLQEETTHLLAAS